MIKYFEHVKNLLYPKICEGCGRVGRYLCETCRINQVEYMWGNVCHVCKQEVITGLTHLDCKEYSYLDGAVSIAKYIGVIESLIKEAKYQFAKDILEELVDLLAKKVLEHRALFEGGSITYVPATHYRQNWRGFNQSQVLAELLAAKLELSCLPILKRAGNTIAQAKLNRVDRLRNLQNVFKLNSKLNVYPLPSKVIIVDDVITKGATLEQCAKVFRQNGVNKIYGLTIATG